jgi:DNA-binding NarL/FixJ family response regulator
MVDHKDHRSIGTLVAIDEPGMQEDLVAAFIEAGISEPRQARNAAQLRDVLGSAELDLIVMSSEMGGEFVAPLITEIRRGRLGPHSFPIILALVADADSVKLRQVSNCGPDDQIALPCEPQDLVDRINSFLAGGRRPLVVNAGYAGPERRTMERAESDA